MNTDPDLGSVWPVWPHGGQGCDTDRPTRILDQHSGSEIIHKHERWPGGHTDRTDFWWNPTTWLIFIVLVTEFWSAFGTGGQEQVGLSRFQRGKNKMLVGVFVNKPSKSTYFKSFFLYRKQIGNTVAVWSLVQLRIRLINHILGAHAQLHKQQTEINVHACSKSEPDIKTSGINFINLICLVAPADL